MVSEIPPLVVNVVFNTEGITAGTAKAKAALESVAATGKTASAGIVKFGGVMKSVFGGIILAEGLMGVTHMLQEMKQEALNTEVSLGRLDLALENAGVKSKESKNAVIENSKAYEKLGFQAFQALDAMGTLVTATGSVTQANKLLAMSADLARFKHIDLETAARILARGTQGSAKAFKELGITLDTSIPKNQAIAKAFDELNKKIAGQAIAYTKTFAGQMAILKEKFQQIADELSVYVIPMFSKLLGLVSLAIDWFQKNSGALKVFTVLLVTYTAVTSAAAIATWGLDAALGALIFALESPIVAIMALAAGFVFLWNHWKTFRETMAETAATIVYAISSVILAHARLFALVARVTHIKFFQNLADDAEKASKKLDGVATSIDKLKNKKITVPNLLPTGGTKPGGKTGIEGGVIDTGKLGGSPTVQYVTVYASNTNDIYKKLSKAAKNGQPVGAK